MNSDIKCVEALTNPISVHESQQFKHLNNRITPQDLEQKNYDGK